MLFLQLYKLFIEKISSNKETVTSVIILNQTNSSIKIKTEKLVQVVFSIIYEVLI